MKQIIMKPILLLLFIVTIGISQAFSQSANFIQKYERASFLFKKGQTATAVNMLEEHCLPEIPSLVAEQKTDIVLRVYKILIDGYQRMDMSVSAHDMMKDAMQQLHLSESAVIEKLNGIRLQTNLSNDLNSNVNFKKK
jgi:hypothetical protein